MRSRIDMTYRSPTGRPARRASRVITAVLAISAIAFSVAAQERGGDRAREERGDTADRPQVWFAPNDDLPRPNAPGGFLNRDFPRLFDAKPAWNPDIDVFKISPKMGSTIGPAGELTRISAFLKGRRIALAVSVGTMLIDSRTPVPGECGFGVEGSNRPGRNAQEFRRLKQLGLDVRYVAMDEPLTFGHYYNKRNACRFSIEDVARRVAAAIAEIRQYYPDVRVVDEEAPPITTTAQWNADFPKWLAAYRRATGGPLDAVMYDLDWRQPWQTVVGPGARVARNAGVRVGIFLDGTGPGASDAEAVAAYKRNIQAVDASGLKFDLVDVANWTPHPSHNLPQSDPDTLTSVLAWYLRRHDANVPTAGASAAVADDDRRTWDRDAHPPEVWIGPQSLPLAPLARDADFMQLFTPDARWRVAAAHTRVFKLYGSFVGHATQLQIDAVVADLKRRHIAIALENGILDVPNKPTPPCGGLGLIEGYGTPAQAERIAGMIKVAGGEIRYLVMDEPLYYGHFSSKPHACHTPIKLLLQQMQPTIAAYREVFPDIVIGEVEPTRFPAYAGWRAALEEWLNGEREALGRPVAFVQLDIPWTDDGQHVPGATLPSHEPDDAITVYQALKDLRRQHLVDGIGLIEDGTPKDTTDAAWVQDARNHLQLLEGQDHLTPDQEVFQSWMPHPSRALPETQPDTLTSLVDWYVDRQRPH